MGKMTGMQGSRPEQEESSREHNLQDRNGPRSTMFYVTCTSHRVDLCTAVFTFVFVLVGKADGDGANVELLKKENYMMTYLSNWVDGDCNLERSSGTLHFLIVPTGYKITFNYSELTSRP